ncbi:aldo/keto reductase [Celeribacter indicus]|uniref:Aldo/keto reductase n=1 Tax=Celeribacter indicus TaxID=1208324 RepID=A0A0B5E0D1_9RHOB|nr:aldo/keto reductase [Celeribacter indicus]AJE48689.1 aldo/keto reductase [Celeribacter indicus]SDX12910.1 Predicted oxidoreductase [Celeribacter indicus]
MTNTNAKSAGTFKIGGEIEIARLGFGGLRLAGQGGGSYGPPEDREEVLKTLRRLLDLGINFVDTADSYGPDVSEELIREALHPYRDGLVVATKGGVVRPSAEVWVPVGRPEYLIQQAHKSLRNLGLDQIDLWQLHRVDPQVPADEQYDAVRQLIDEGTIRHAGLSEVGIAEIEAASKFFPVATVQNMYNLTTRVHDAVVDYCTDHGIGFIPWFPLAAGALAQPGSILGVIAGKHEASPSQIAIAWLLKRSPVILPIPGTSKVRHLEQNVQAASITLSDEDFAELDAAGRTVSAG